MTEAPKKGYWVGMVDVTDPQNYPKYIAANKAALECFHSPEYQAALKLRRAYKTAHFAIVEGV